ncbi:MAG: FG-GAP-like repeat-containing protein, partial [Armatimonadaceae bacterium]
GIPVQPWGTSAAFADIDLDGKTDLIIANYVAYNPDKGTRERCDFRSPSGTTVLGACGPREYVPLQAAVFHNTNGLKFTDITKTAGIKTSGRGLGIAALDINQNGKVRIAIANDESPGDLLAVESTKPLKLSNVGPRSGTAYDMDGKMHGGMGVDWGDFDNDGQFDLAVATFETEPMSLYHSDGPDLFSDVSVPSNTAFPTRSLVTFGLRMVDIDNDGLLDIITTNGHVMDNVQDIKPKSVFKQPSQLLRNIDGKRFEDATPLAGPAFMTPIVGRGLAVGDINNDGCPDVVTIDSFGGVHIYANENTASGAWIGLKLIGTKSTRDGSGAIVTVKAGGKTFVRHAHTDGSYMSASDGRVIVGLGQVSGPVDVSIRWPSGLTQQLTSQALGSYITVTEGAK